MIENPPSTFESAHTAPAKAQPLILFDGDCRLCDASMQWIIARDRRGEYRFAAQQSQTARTALSTIGLAQPPQGSIVLIEHGQIFTHSTAILRIVARLGPPWSWLSFAGMLPRGLRDAVYGWVARNRYRWFGRRETCQAQPPEVRRRFLDADDSPPLATSARATQAASEIATPAQTHEPTTTSGPPKAEPRP